MPHTARTRQAATRGDGGTCPRSCRESGWGSWVYDSSPCGGTRRSCHPLSCPGREAAPRAPWASRYRLGKRGSAGLSWKQLPLHPQLPAPLPSRTGEPDEEEGTFRSSIRRLSTRRR
uniref:Uncharacterized protein n=1 Tax=Oryctolagus cuniculus TaxID=9986 RepID=A0A5F9C3B8_RABIT